MTFQASLLGAALLVLVVACSTPVEQATALEPVDCVFEWDKTCPRYAPWETVSYREAEVLEARGQREARFQLGVVFSADCAIDRGGVTVSISRHAVAPFVRKALRSREDCLRCELDRVDEFVAHDVEADVIAALPGTPPGWSYRNAMLHPDRPFHVYGSLLLEAALVHVVREPGRAPEPAALLRRCPDSEAMTCERLVFGEGTEAQYFEAARRASDEADARMLEEEQR
ncbi:MAG: hypothetical protein AB8I08_11405 [Sandaracinaceae bacterium]